MSSGEAHFLQSRFRLQAIAERALLCAPLCSPCRPSTISPIHIAFLRAHLCAERRLSRRHRAMQPAQCCAIFCRNSVDIAKKRKA